MDADTLFTAILSLIGTLAGTFGGILTSAKLTNYRIERLEKEVEKHNSVVERTYVLEEGYRNVKDEIEEIRDDIRSMK